MLRRDSQLFFGCENFDPKISSNAQLESEYGPLRWKAGCYEQIIYNGRVVLSRSSSILLSWVRGGCELPSRGQAWCAKITWLGNASSIFPAGQTVSPGPGGSHLHPAERGSARR